MPLGHSLCQVSNVWCHLCTPPLYVWNKISSHSLEMSSIPNFLIIPTLKSHLVSLYTCCSLSERLLIKAITLLLFKFLFKYYPPQGSIFIQDISSIPSSSINLLSFIIIIYSFNTYLHLALYIYLYICLYSIVSFQVYFMCTCVVYECMCSCMWKPNNWCQVSSTTLYLIFETLIKPRAHWLAKWYLGIFLDAISRSRIT